jgi:hypothetical protein
LMSVPKARSTGYDQYGNLMSPQPSFGWSVSGGNTIGAGLLTAVESVAR